MTAVSRSPRRRRRPSTTFLPISASSLALRPLKAAEGVARDIVDEIVRKGLSTGDNLPPEAAMLRQYGVSRETLREGLRLLEVQGLISIRRGPGGGPSVGTVDPANLGRIQTLYYHLAGATYRELFEAWVLAERTIAQLAARNPDRELVHRVMEPYLDCEAVAPDDELATFVTYHSRFHVDVASLARNRVLQLSLMTVGQIITHHVAVNADPRDARDRIRHDHADIARAIIAGHHHRAREVMEEHIQSITDFYLDEVGPQMADIIGWH